MQPQGHTSTGAAPIPDPDFPLPAPHSALSQLKPHPRQSSRFYGWGFQKSRFGDDTEYRIESDRVPIRSLVRLADSVQ